MIITVVIPTYNRRDLLAQCLESLFRQAHRADDFEIVVVVDGSTDQTQDYLRTLQFPCAHQVLEQQNLGQAAARNRGIRAAHGHYILLLDDDFICDPDLIQEHLKAHDGSRTVIVGPILHDQGELSIPALAIDREIRPFYERLESGLEPGTWCPPNSSVARDILLATVGYDEQFSQAREDTDLGIRLTSAGVSLRYAPKAVVRQRYSKSASELIAGAALFGKHDVLLARKFPSYLAQSNLSRVMSGPRWKRMLRRIAVQLPFSPEPFLASLYWPAALIRRSLIMREAAIRLLNLRRYIVWLRAAAREVGGWATLVSFAETSQLRAKGSSNRT